MPAATLEHQLPAADVPVVAPLCAARRDERLQRPRLRRPARTADRGVGDPARIELFAADRFADLVSALSLRFGRQPQLPHWAYAGAILGLKDGAASFDRMDAIVDAGAVVTGLWCEDWVGLRHTSFGARLFWDWRADKRYPGLRQRIADLRDRGIRFLGYVNPYLAIDGALYVEARKAGHLARRLDADEPYLVDFGEFDCGIVDFTKPAAADWFAGG
ncbi:TIM-barrel domain-containing protein [Sphingomonas sp. MMS24-JH45]